MSRFLGIDFSGNHLMWRPGCGRSNVWISDVKSIGHRLVLDRLLRIHELPGDHHPFERLVALLRKGDFEAAAIDAPFSVPHKFVLPDYAGFLKRIGLMENPAGRPFPSACEFVKAVSGADPPLDPQKPLRVTEDCWKGEGLNVRSTLWAGARGGAAMTAACLRVLHSAQRPIWPWAIKGSGLLVEAFPMAQLFRWSLPFTGYSGNDPPQRAARGKIISGIQPHVVTTQFDTTLHANADALDAVLAGLAAIAVTMGRLASAPGPIASREGWIAVHS